MATLCEALRTNGEMAAFVALSITTIGHTIVDFQVRMILGGGGGGGGYCILPQYC